MITVYSNGKDTSSRVFATLQILWNVRCCLTFCANECFKLRTTSARRIEQYFKKAFSRKHETWRLWKKATKRCKIDCMPCNCPVRELPLSDQVYQKAFLIWYSYAEHYRHRDNRMCAVKHVRSVSCRLSRQVRSANVPFLDEKDFFSSNVTHVCYVPGSLIHSIIILVASP